MITSKMKKVYYSPTRGRHFLTLDGACNAESKHQIITRYQTRNEPDTGDCFYAPYDLEDYSKLAIRLARYIKYNFKRLEGER